MKKTDNLQNKGFQPNERVRIKIKPGRAITGVGGPGEIVSVSKSEAEQIVSTGYATYYVEE